MPGVSLQDAVQQVEELVARGQFTEAEKLARAMVRELPTHSAGRIALGLVLERTGRHLEAVRTYEEITHHHPGHGHAFTRRSLALLRAHWGDPKPPRPSRGDPRVTCATLGANGRFANQMFQYAATRLYADAHGLEAEFPDWIGRDLFDHDDPFVVATLPQISENDADILNALTASRAPTFAGRDFQGYFQRDTSLFAPRRKAFTDLFQPGAKLAPLLRTWRQALRLDTGATLVALHLRRGDFGYGDFWIAPEAWYLRWLESVWPLLKQPVLYIATDDASVINAFQDFGAIGSAQLGPALPGAEFFVDFYALTQANHLAISNSSFSFIAAMLNETAGAFLRPEKVSERLVPFDPWAAPVMLRYPS